MKFCFTRNLIGSHITDPQRKRVITDVTAPVRHQTTVAPSAAVENHNANAVTSAAAQYGEQAASERSRYNAVANEGCVRFIDDSSLRSGCDTPI